MRKLSTAACTAFILFAPFAGNASDASLIDRLTRPGPLAEREHALDEMQALDASSKKALLPELTEALKGKNSTVRQNAAEAIGALDEQGLAGVDNLRQAEKDPVPEVRHTASVSLARLGYGDPTLVDKLISGLQIQPGATNPLQKTSAMIERYDAANDLAFIASGPRHIDITAAVPALGETVRNDPDDNVRNRAAWTLGTMGRQAHKALPALRSASHSPAVGDVASWAMDQIGQ